MCSTSIISASSSRVVPLRGVLGEQRPDRVGDLAPAAVPDGDVDHQSLDVAGAVGRLLEAARSRGREQVERADGVQPPALLLGQRLHGVGDDVEQRRRAHRRDG